MVHWCTRASKSTIFIVPMNIVLFEARLLAKEIHIFIIFVDHLLRGLRTFTCSHCALLTTFHVPAYVRSLVIGVHSISTKCLHVYSLSNLISSSLVFVVLSQRPPRDSVEGPRVSSNFFLDFVQPCKDQFPTSIQYKKGKLECFQNQLLPQLVINLMYLVFFKCSSK